MLMALFIVCSGIRSISGRGSTCDVSVIIVTVIVEKQYNFAEYITMLSVDSYYSTER
jgi:hypothetical protein